MPNKETSRLLSWKFQNNNRFNSWGSETRNQRVERTKLHPYSNSKLEMADVHIPDDIIINILGRLPAKPLLRSRCVSKHWCRLISDPCFMNSRSRKKILFRGPPLYALDDNHNSMAKLPYPFENQSGRHVTMIGTFKGIVVLVVIDRLMGYASHILLYNPFTRVSKIVHDPYSPFNKDIHLYGFAYGDDDLKIVRLRDSNLSDNIPNRSWKTCDVLNLKTSLWSSSEILIKDAQLLDDVGTYAKGFLYWNAFEKIVALNVKEMVISEIYLTIIPRYDPGCRLGTLYGRLCIINNDRDTRCNVWIMKEEENSWSKACSFTFGQDLGYPGYGYGYRLLDIMDDGRVLMTDAGYHVIIYDTSKHSSRILNFNSPKFRIDDRARGMEYMETLISPLKFVL